MSNEIEKSPMALRMEERMLEIGFANKGRLSAASGVSRAILTNIARRPEKEIWATVAVRIANTLKCRVEWLINGVGPVTDEVQEIHTMVYGDCMKLGLEELALEELTTESIEEARLSNAGSLHCPVKAGALTVAIKTDIKLGSIDVDDYVFVDLERKNPRPGQLVLARKAGSGHAPEFYNYGSALDKKYLMSLNDDLPKELRLIEITDGIEVVGCVVASTKIF